MKSPSNPSIQKWLPLLLVSSISLFMELAIIRWLSGEIRIMAYYKNLTLLAAFIGLAIGFSLVKKGRDYLPAFPLWWICFVAITLAVGYVDRDRLIAFPGSGNLYIWETGSLPFWFSLLAFLLVICVFFFVTVFLFIPLGQAVGKEMDKFSPIPAYVGNIIASLIGVWAFSLLSYFQTPPWLWFAIALIGVVLYDLKYRKLSLTQAGIYAASIVVIGVVGSGTIWSPYNRLKLLPVSYIKPDGSSGVLGYQLDVQTSFYQHAFDLSPREVTQLEDEHADNQYIEFVKSLAYGYDLPYQLVKNGSRILIVGSGMGNDVAAALRNGAAQVDAVEIDSTIYELGKELHPEKPYDDNRVHVIIDDARSYFNKPHEPYDLVVFGLLDSHTLLSGMSSVRLDSFVYTLESFQKVSHLIKPGGYLVVTFAANDWIEQRLGRMLGQVFGSDNLLSVRWAGENYLSFISGPETLSRNPDPALVQWQPDPAYDNIPLTTDDWPYIYQRSRQLTPGYWQTLVVVGVLCLLLAVRSFPEVLHPDWQFFLLGAAFLLIEFKSITELALLFGTTWFVNSLAISGVLVMALGANIFVLKRTKINLTLAYLLLFAALAFGALFPLQSLISLPAALKALLSAFVLFLPLFFSGIIFSESLRRAGETARPLASNFAGSAVGGLLEYGSSLWGIKSLYLVAALLYLGALASIRRRKG